MGEPITGSWGRIYTVPYSGATKWGTGINPIHQFYGESYPLRTYGRNASIPAITPPSEATPGFIETSAPWGYQPEDIAGLDVFASPVEATDGVEFVKDSWPAIDQGTVQFRSDVPEQAKRPWQSTGFYKNILRSIRTSAGNINYQPTGFSYQIPMETVSEGWLNKPASGMGEGEVADSVTSARSQYEVQTSMSQRYRQQNNRRAVLRATDDERAEIDSRVAPMKLKVYSGQERHYDMFPRQMDDIPRPFWYRRAATGVAADMEPNAMVVITPIQRTVPPDPSLGTEDTALTEGDYGYTNEDGGWY